MEHSSQEKVTVFISGVSGFIGFETAKLFSEKGAKVFGGYRTANKRTYLLEEMGVELVQGNLLNPPPALAKAIAQAERIVHIAGYTNDWGRAQDFFKANTETSVALYKRAMEGSCSHFCYTSSISVHGFGPHVNSTESGPYYPHHSPYQRSKALAERKLLQLSSTGHGPALTIVRPGNVYGPGDTTMMYPLFDQLVSGTIPHIDHSRYLTCPIHVQDMAECFWLSQRAPNGEVFDVTSGERVTWSTIYRSACEALGCKEPRFSLPSSVVKLAGWLNEKVFKGLGLYDSRPMTRYLAAQMTNHYHFSTEKQQSVLGFRAKYPLDRGIRETAESYLRGQ